MSPEAIVGAMMANDAHSAWLGIHRLGESLGWCMIRMTVRPDMCNGFGVCHGGVTFAFADSCFAFACNTRGHHAVSIESNITHLAPVHAGDMLVAEAEEQSVSRQFGVYYVKVRNEQSGKTVALFKGTCYRKNEKWEEHNPATGLHPHQG
jgi:acyl-CoA thioesterase